MKNDEDFNGIAAIHAFIEEKRKLTGSLKTFSCPNSIDALKGSIQFKLEEEAETLFIPKEDIFVELGSPQHESVSFIVITQDPAEIREQITLIGPDIPESEGKDLNLGQVLLLGGSKIQDFEYKNMERALFHLKNLEGYMIRAIPNKIWSRVNKQVGQRGFSFEAIGKALMIMYKQQFPAIETMEILFITLDSPETFLELKIIGTEIRKTYIEQYSEQLKSKLSQISEKQRDDCEYPWSCEECDYNAVCDEIRDIVDKMKAYREKTQKK
ncbi:MAG TPA: hypothetical protein VMV49_05390 [Candidatus Deferrimicrobium sp.]|nr:hypothetical protein [Candidatus Deferrimicrobium sp.]